MTLYIASSELVGRRPRISRIRAYSSALRPRSAHGCSRSGSSAATATVSRRGTVGAAASGTAAIYRRGPRGQPAGCAPDLRRRARRDAARVRGAAWARRREVTVRLNGASAYSSAVFSGVAGLTPLQWWNPPLSAGSRPWRRRTRFAGAHRRPLVVAELRRACRPRAGRGRAPAAPRRVRPGVGAPHFGRPSGKSPQQAGSRPSGREHSLRTPAGRPSRPSSGTAAAAGGVRRRGAAGGRRGGGLSAGGALAGPSSPGSSTTSDCRRPALPPPAPRARPTTTGAAGRRAGGAVLPRRRQRRGRVRRWPPGRSGAGGLVGGVHA